MPSKVSPVFQIFQNQHLQAKELFLSLGKQVKSKKATQLAAKMDFLELYSELMDKIHFDVDGLNFDIYAKFKPLQRVLHKVHYFKLAENGLTVREHTNQVKYNSYRQHLDKYKKHLYSQAFELILGTTLGSWEELYQKAQKASRNIDPLAINTASTQLIEDELKYFKADHNSPMDSKSFKDTFEGLRTIIMLENLRIHLGFNPIFVYKIHQEIEDLKENLKPWYANHLSMQSLTYFVSDRDEASKKYLDWLKELKSEKKVLSAKVEKQAHKLFEKILS